MSLSSLRRGSRAVAVALLASLALLVIAAGSARAATQTFTTLASSPNPVNDVVVDPTTNLIYAQRFEGTAFYSYNPATNAWTTLPSSPISMGNNGGAAYLNGKIYASYNGSSTMGIYDIATQTWSTIPNPAGGATGNITASGSLIYEARGSSFVSYNPTTTTTTTLAPPPFSFSSWGVLASYNGKIYGTEGNGSSGFAVYDIGTNTWTTLASVPSGAVLGGAIDPTTGTFYTYGEYGGDTFDIYDIATGTWTTTTFPYSDINDGGMAYVSTAGLQGIYAVYGENSPGFTRYNTAGEADVSVTKSASAKRVTVGHKFTYTLTVKNAGPNSAADVSVSDTLPSKVTFDKDSTTAGTCSGKSTVTCKLGTLAPGASATVKITVKAVKTGKPRNTARLATPSSNLSTKTSSSATVKIVAVKLKLTVTPTHATAGTSTCYAFRGSSGGKAVHGAKVTLAGHSAKTSSAGRATLCLTLKKGTYHARISKSGYSSATAAIRVTAAPAFTG